MEGLLNGDEVDNLIESSEEVDNSNSTEVKKFNPNDGSLEVKKGDKVNLISNTKPSDKINIDVFEGLQKLGMTENDIAKNRDFILNNETYKNFDRLPTVLKEHAINIIFNDATSQQPVDKNIMPDTTNNTPPRVGLAETTIESKVVPETQASNTTITENNNTTIKSENTSSNTTANKRTTFAEINLENGKRLEIIEKDNGMLDLKKINNDNGNIESTKKVHKNLYESAINRYNETELNSSNDDKIRELIKSERDERIKRIENYDAAPEEIKKAEIKKIIESQKNISDAEVTEYKDNLLKKLDTDIDKAKEVKIKELMDNKIEELKQAEINKLKEQKIEELRQTEINKIKSDFDNFKQNEIKLLRQADIDKINNMTFDDLKDEIPDETKKTYLEMKKEEVEVKYKEIKELAISKKNDFNGKTKRYINNNKDALIEEVKTNKMKKLEITNKEGLFDEDIKKIKEQKKEEIKVKTYDDISNTENIKNLEISVNNQIEEIKSKEYSLTEKQIKEIETSANNKEYTQEELKKVEIDESEIKKIKEKIIASDERYKLVSEEPVRLTEDTAKTDAGYHEWLLKEEQKYITERKGLKNVFVDGDNLGHIITKDAKNNLYINNSLEPLKGSETFFRGDGSVNGEELIKNQDFVKAFTADKKKAIQNLPALQSFLKENYSYSDDVISEEIQGINKELKGSTLGEIFGDDKELKFKVKREDGKTSTEVTKSYSEVTFNGAKTERNGDFYNTTFFAKTEVEGKEITVPLVLDKHKNLVYKTGSSPNGILKRDVLKDKFRYDNHFDLYENFFNKNKIKLDGSEAEGVIVDTIKDIFGKSSGVEKDDLKIKSLDQIEKFRNAAINYDEMLNPKKKGILGFASGITSSIIGRANSVEVDISEFGFEGNDNAPKVITINNEMAANLRETATKIQNASDDVIKHNYDKRKMENNNDSFFTRKGDLDKANYEVFDDATKDIKEGIVKKTSFSKDGVRHRVFQQDGNFYSIATEVGKDIKQSESGKEVAELSHKLMSVTEKNGMFTIGGEIDAKTIEEGSILKSVINKLGSIDEGDISKNSISLERLNLAKSNSTISKLTEAGLGNDGMKGFKSMAGLGIAAGILFTIKSVADASKEQRRTKQMEIMALRDKYQGNPVY